MKSINRFFLIFGIVLILVAYIFGLFIDLTGDSGLYAAITRQMVESGDWWNLKINGIPYDQKPHLFFWLAGIGVQLFGNTNFAFKLFPFIYALAGIYFTYRLGKQIFSEEIGKLAALITGTSQMFFLYLFDYHTDTVLQTGVVLALWQLAAYLQNKKASHFIFGFIGVGLAMLAKGPVGAVLPFFAVLFYLLYQKDFRQLFHPKWILGLLIIFSVVSPSLVHLFNNFGIEGLQFFFITNNVGRITGEYAGSSTECLFYVHTFLWAFLPWTLFVLFSLFTEIKTGFKNKEQLAWSFYLLGSVGVLFIILSVARGKAPNYFFIEIVPIAIITAKWLTIFENENHKKPTVLIQSQVIFVCVFALGLVFVFATLFFVKLWVALLIALLLIGAVFYFLKQKKPTLNSVLLLSALIIGGLNLFLNSTVIPELYTYQGARQALSVFNEHKKAGSKLYNFETEGNELYYYSKENVSQIEKWDELRAAMNTGKAWIYTNEIKYKNIVDMKYDIDTVFTVRQRGMNRINLKFLNPATRENSLKAYYLIVAGDNFK